MATRSRSRGGRGPRLAAVAVALLAHLAVGAALLASVRRLVLPPEPPPLEVELVRPDAARPPPELPPPPPATTRAGRAPADPLPFRTPRPSRAAPLPQPSAVAPAPPAPPSPRPPAGGAQQQDDVAGRVRDALRTSVGCDDDPLIGLSARERAACDRRRAQAAREARGLLPSQRERAAGSRADRRDVHKELRPDWDCAAGGSLSCRGSAVMVGGSIPFGYVPKALPPIPPSTLYGDDRIRKKEEPKD